MTIKNFRARDFKKGSDGVLVVPSRNDRIDRFEAPVPTSRPVVSEDPNEVPNGTVPELMTWVGDDVERAQKVLDKEVEDEKPRKGLVARLQEIIDSSEEFDANSDEVVDEETEEEN